MQRSAWEIFWRECRRDWLRWWERPDGVCPLVDGPIDPHDVLSVLGIKELQRYLVDKIQEVYRSQSVAINDKHIEVICRQMLRSVRVTRVGDTDFLVDGAGRSLPLHGRERKGDDARRRTADGTPLLLGSSSRTSGTRSTGISGYASHCLQSFGKLGSGRE